MTLISRSWMLDPVEFHRDFESHFDDLADPGDLANLRNAALRVWLAKDPFTHGYLSVLRTAGPDQWEAGFAPQHLLDWYRVLMAPFLTPTRAFRSPDLLKRRLPDLGWPRAEARRLSHGRELQVLAEAFASDRVAGELALSFSFGNKGWLSQDDIDHALARMRRLDRGCFRRNQDLVPAVENAYEVLEAAATKPDHVLLMIGD